MKRLFAAVAATVALTMAQFGAVAGAAEHGGSPLGAEHPGQEITARTVKNAIKDHVKKLAKANKGMMLVHDDKLNKEWRLTLDKVHDPVRSFEQDGKIIYFACSDFRSVDTPDVLDIDFWMVEKDGGLQVIDTRIHKINGTPRYTYEGTTIKEIR